MVLLLIIIASWILVLSVVVGLCLSARQGDHQQLNASHTSIRAPSFPCPPPRLADRPRVAHHTKAGKPLSRGIHLTESA